MEAPYFVAPLGLVDLFHGLVSLFVNPALSLITKILISVCKITLQYNYCINI